MLADVLSCFGAYFTIFMLRIYEIYFQRMGLNRTRMIDIRRYIFWMIYSRIYLIFIV